MFDSLLEKNSLEVINPINEKFDPNLHQAIKTIENDKKDVKIIMSLTTPGCTMGQHMADDIKNKAEALKEINNIEVNVTFDPPWTPEMMTDYAREKLGYDPVKTKNTDQKINVEWE